MQVTHTFFLAGLFFIRTLHAFCQSPDPVIQWDNTIGGNGNDRLTAVCITSDGGYVLGGNSDSGISGDKTEASSGSADMWIIKLNAAGAIEWQNTIGSSAYDYVAKVVQAIDGGYLIVGYTTGGISGDKTEAAVGGNDYWILKLDATGNMVWQNTIGGTATDTPVDVLALPSGSFIIGGTSNSGISGDKTVAGYGNDDYWLMKINAGGSILWQRDFGGSDIDKLTRVLQDGSGFLLLGYSKSNISGIKTENTNGGYDFWVIKINASGDILWQNTIGGDGGDILSDAVQMADGGYMFFGTSASDISGDKSEISYNQEYIYFEDIIFKDSQDFWIVRTDASGNVLWDKTLGDHDLDQDVVDVVQLESGRLLLASYRSWTLSSSDYYVQCIDTLGFPVWSDYYFGNSGFEDSEDMLTAAVAVPGNGFLVAGLSKNNAGFDKSENATAPDKYDYWILKIGQDTCIAHPYYFDIDQDTYGGNYAGSACEMDMQLPYIMNNDDCDDRFSTIYPGSPEYCDGMDNSCDGIIDEGLISCDPGPELLFEHAYGGEGPDYITDMHATVDGGYIIGGYTASQTGDFDTNYGEEDYFLIKTDASGNLQWQKTYGGSGRDVLHSVYQTADGGFIVGGESLSGATGVKTEPSYGSFDLWILKLDALGNIIWQKDIGGNLSDSKGLVIPTSDGGYMIQASSSSGISGLKTEMNYGSSDYWVIKLDATGNIVWQNTIGGSGFDVATSVIETSDGNFLLGGYSRSGISGEKTNPNYGSDDYWVIKINATGSILWQQDLGGSNTDDLSSMTESGDGNYIVVGNSSSGISGNKTEASISSDYWLVKLNANTGGVIGQRDIQAEGYDKCNSIVRTPDNGYLLLGYSASEAGFEKNEPAQNAYWDWDLGGSFYAGYDYWLIKIDSITQIEWQMDLGGGGDDIGISVAMHADGSFAIAGYSNSGDSGDKTFPLHQHIMEVGAWPDDLIYHSDQDIWLMCFHPEVCVPSEEICNAMDDDCNGIIDDGVVESISIMADGPLVFCQGGTVGLHATYTGASVQWKKNGVNIPGATLPDYTASIKGMYSCVTSSDCGTATSTTLNVNVQKNPSAMITALGPTTFCAGGSVVLNANTGAGLSYQWYKNAVPVPGATTFSYTATEEGIYKCQVIKTASGCSKFSNGIHVVVPCRQGEEGAVSSALFPNPNNGSFTLSIQNAMRGDYFIEVRNASGSIVLVQQFDSNSNTFQLHIDLPDVPSGMYYLNCSGPNLQEEQIIVVE
ncbi:MAG: MopE-related protein [Chitinophagales bacterium]